MVLVTFAVAGSLLLIAMSNLVREGRPYLGDAFFFVCAGTLLSLATTHEWPWWIGGVVGAVGYLVSFLVVLGTVKVLVRRRRGRHPR